MDLGTPALVVPDDLAWTLWGADPYAAGLCPVSDAGAARHVLLPDRLPRALGPALARLGEDLPADRRVEVRAAPVLHGPRLERVLTGVVDGERPDGNGDHSAGHGHEGDGHEGDGPEGDGHEGDGPEGDGPEGDGHEGDGHEGHDHADMMAITGAPGSDGLVMEPIDTAVGPLGGPLPGGLRVGVRLAGDVVERCEVVALLEAGAIAPDRPPDPLAPSAWEAVVHTATVPEGAARGWARVAAVEVERAVSHVAWLRAFARLLGWTLLVEACSAALIPLTAARRHPYDSAAPSDELARGLEALASLRRVVRGRRMAARTRGRAVVGAGVVARDGLTGPVARAAGVARDARMDDAAYATLAFEAVVEDDGDARARTVVRHAEAVAAVEIAVAALARASHPAESGEGPTPFEDGTGGALVEGPRGPLRAWGDEDGRLRGTAPGSEALRSVAARSAIGQEWAGALVCLASFDLSPWRVGG
ncbi:MAG TPA: hypothetical protein VGV40_12545 [Solirubrobacteraceae bacterium]|nr:hypothetical protein [Solirubrobacteraceae bacterium]